ncbi:MAG TPA: hypothetical protein ACFYD2_01980 [Candidatus Avalokitesvara rifleensis]|uniref:hypothetical protein n=1 Tax=Candidatus Avalokitesvara rifleensis TaxID=3367620 RepID=UPI00271386E2|nr:hypothetical protein [Candidatus Brocadiales bacterium]
MLHRIGIIRESAKRIAKAVDDTVEDLKKERIEQEPAFTDRMLARIEQVLGSVEIKGVQWTAKTLTDRGPNAQEKIYGADFVGILHINIPEFKVAKGFLAQAKLLEPSAKISNREMQRMKDQCEQMLKLSPASFLFLYSTRGVTVVPAIAIVSSNVNPYELYRRGVSRFFEEHFESFIGDRRVSCTDNKTLERLSDECNARNALLLKAEMEGMFMLWRR